MRGCPGVLARRIAGIESAAWRLPALRRKLCVAGAAVGIGLGLLLALSAPASAGTPPVPTFCNVTGLSNCAGPVTAPADDISGSQQRQIEQRLQQLRCEGRDDPACAGVGGAAADTVSYEGLSLFVSADYQHKDKKNTPEEIGFESDSFGPTVGVDYRLGTDGVIGLAFDYAHAIGDFDGGYGDFDTDTFTWVFFGSYFPTDETFIDASLGLGYKTYDTEHADPGGGAGTIESSTGGFELTADVTGGYDFSFGAASVGPRVGLHYKRSALNGFTETGTGTLFSYDDQVKESLTATVGAQATYAISTSFGVIVPSVNAEYVREFLDDRETYSATQVGGGSVSFITDKPDLNHFNLGAGVVVLLPEGISPFISYEAEVANSLEKTHTFTGGVRIEL